MTTSNDLDTVSHSWDEHSEHNGLPSQAQVAEANPAQKAAPAAAEPVPVDVGNGTPVKPEAPAEAKAPAAAAPHEYVADANHVVKLPANVSIDNIKVDGHNLVLEQADGSVIVIKDGALNVPTFIIGDVEVPRVALIAALEASHVDVAFGADGSISAGAGGSPSSAGGDFSVPPGGIGDGFGLSALLPPTDLAFGQPEHRELFPSLLPNSTPTILDLNPETSGGDTIVYEHGLTSVADTSEINTGTFAISSPDGIGSLTVNGQVISGAALANSASAPINITTPLGNTLTINGYDAATGQVSYSYTLEHSEQHPAGADNNSIFDNMTVTVTDTDGDVSAPGTLSVQIVDDVPVAHNANAGALTEDGAATTVGGNVTTDYNNTFGADGPAAASPVNWGTATAMLNGGAVNLTDYGTLTQNANGTWSFVLDNSKPATQALETGDTINVSLGYTLTDHDSDADSKTITFEINGAHDSSTVTVTPSDDANAGGASNVVYEHGLTSVADTSETDTGTFKVTATDGIKDVTIGTETHTLSDWLGKTINTGEGTLTITGVTPAGAGTEATFAYSYTLNAAQAHPAGNGNNTLPDSVAVAVDGIGGTHGDGTISIVIVDDVPVAHNANAGALTEDGAATTVGGNVTTDYNNTFGADGPAAASPVNWGTATAMLNGGAVNLTDYGTLTQNANGTWSFVLDNSKPATQALETGDTINVSLGYTLTDHDSDADSKTITFEINGAHDSSTVTVTPSDDANAGGASNVVYEHGLTSVADTSETDTGTFKVTATDGIKDVTIGTETHTLSDWLGKTINTGEGTLTITGVTPAGAGTEATFAYSYTLNAAQAHPAGNGNNTLPDSVAVAVDGIGGTHGDGTISIVIVDDVPVAHNANAGALTEDGAATTVGGNVTTDYNNTFGADGPAAASPVNWGTATAMLNGGAVNLTDYGTLTQNANGTWSFVLDNSKPATQALETGDTINVSLGYTLTDHDSDADSKTITFEINGAHDSSTVTVTPSDDANAGGASNVVYEHGLTSVADTSETDTGTFKVTATDGIKDVTIGTETHTLSDWLGKTINTGEGTLTITGVTPAGAGTEATFAYSYTLNAAQAHPAGNGNNTLPDSVAVAVDGIGGTHGDGTISIVIVDDVPVAHNANAGALTEDGAATTVGGNVTTDYNNTFGADGPAAASPVNWGTATAMLNGGAVNLTDYGTLTQNANGTWSFVLDNSKPATQALETGDTINVSLGYTLTDHDSDADSKTITFEINGAHDSSTVTVTPSDDANAGGASNVVYEHGLTSVADTSETDTGTFKVTATDGIKDVTIGTETHTLSDWLGKTINTGEGTLTITGVTPAGAGTEATFAYSYTLNAAQAHPAGNGNNTLPDSVAVAVDGIGGTHGDGTISIVIVDDVPVAHNANAGALTEDGAATTVGGNVTTDYNNTFGADGPAAASPVNWGTATAMLNGGAVNLTDYGTLTQNANGTWSFVLDNSKPATQALETGDTINVSLGYTLTDHDSDADSKTITFEINGAHDSSTVTVTPSDDANAGGASNVVYEHGLTSVADTSETDTGTFKVTATDGIKDVTIGTETHTLSDWLGKTINTGEGTLTITGVTPAGAGTEATFAYSYTLNAAQAHPAGNGNNTLPDSVAVAVDGIGGTHGDGTISIVIVDDVPVAHNANAGALTEDGAATTVGGNVTTDYNNTFGADGPAAASPVNWGTATAMLNGGAVNLTDYGTLTQNANGTWSFVLDNSKPATQALETGDTINVSLGYTLTDHDSDADSKTITFEINGAHDSSTVTVTPSDDANAGGASNVVYEHGLTSVADTSETDTGTFKVTATDGIKDVTIGTETHTLSDWLGKTINTGEGTLTITGVTPAGAGTEATFAYSYTLNAAQAHPAGNGNNTLPDSVAVAVDGIGGTHGDGTISIVIVDDVPVAHNANAGALTEDGAATTVGGNVTTDYNNTFGADGPAAASPVNWGTATAMLNGGAVNLTDYGTLTQNANGTWSFVLDNSKPATQALETGDTINVSLGYTLTDHDSDADSKTITFEINGAHDSSTVTVTPSDDANAGGASNVVYEHGLTSVADTSETDTGTFKVTATDGIKDVTIGTETHTLSDWLGKTINTGEGTLTITGVTPAGAGTEATFAYSYTLNAAQAHPAGNGNNTLPDSVAVAVDGIGGTHGDGTISIVIVDDVPVAHNANAGALTEDGAATTVGGNVTTDYNNTFGADGPAAASPVNWGTATAMLNGGAVNLTDYGTLTQNANGTWSFVLDNSKPATQALETGDTINVSLGYTLTDHDSDADSKTITFEINGAHDSSTVTVTPSDDANAGGASNVVYEHGLTSVADTSETDTGTFKVTATDGIKDVTIGTETHTLSDWLGKTINTGEGTLTITGVTPAGAGTEATFAYSYTLNAAQAHPAGNGNNTLPDSVAVAVDGIGGTHGDGTISIVIVDDVPVAHADTNSVTEGALLSVNAAAGVLANDVAGADGFAAGGAVTGVATGSNVLNPVSGGIGVGIAGQYGTLVLNANGSYAYKANPDAVTANAVDHFVYTITDGDGDTSTVTLDITVNNVTLTPVNQTGQVNEAALDTTTTGSDLTHGSVTGSNPTSPLETVTGQLAVTGTGITYTPISTTTAHGVFELQANGAWTYTLTSPFNSGAVQGANTLTGAESFTYTAKDTNGNTVTGTVKVDVVDDVPKIASIESQIVANAAGAHAGDWTYTSGADGLSTIAISLANQASISQIDHSTSTYDAATGTAKYTAFFDAAGTQPYFTVTMKADGTYNFEVINPVPTIVVTDTTALNAGSFGGNNYGLYLEQIAVKNNIPTPLHTDILFTGNSGWTSGLNLGSQATINSNNHGLGIGSGQTLDNKESITLKFLQGDGDKNSSTHPTTAVGMDHVTINFLQGSNGDAMTGSYAVRVVTYDQNGVAHDQGSMNIVNGVLDISSASLMYGVSIINTGNTGLLVGGTTTSVTTATEIPHDVGLHFNVDVVDGDGDKASHGFDIVVDANDGHQATLTGDAAYDPNILSGGPGDDLLISAPGYNILTGGAGADTFKLDHLDIKDLIADYHGGEGDKIDLSALFDTAPANSISNYVHYNSATSTVSVDTSGSGNAANFVDVAVLQNAPAAGTINILYDDSNHVQHTATI
ncbi:VCBS domain-containing protein [Mesorhizobium jarvisii]|uniref:VCBS domain-containing protein n=2 Tax=Pseudomonadota TaxID=1224 RepID=UPI0014956B2D|nr:MULTISPECIES: VCBS domain-containing protein [Mesorhizobium]